MTHLQRIVMAATLIFSIVAVSHGGTITGSRTSTSGARVGTITGSRTGTITGSRTGTITGSRTGTITGSTAGRISASQDGTIGITTSSRNELLSEIVGLLISLAW